MPTLILQLPAIPEVSPSEYGYVLRSDAGQMQQQGRAAPSLLRQRLGQRGSVVGVVPPAVLSWHLLHLAPALARPLLATRVDFERRHAVLSGALEDHLLDDPAQLHFAVAKASAVQQGTQSSDSVALWVAVIDAGWMRQTLQALEAAGLYPESLVPEVEPEAAPGTGRLVLDGGLAPAAATWCSSVGVWRMPLRESAARWLQERMAAQDTLELLAEPEVMALGEQTLGRSMQVCTLSQRLMQAHSSRWNLAQGEWAAGQGKRRWRALRSLGGELLHGSVWRPARWSLVALVLVQVVVLNALAWRESQAVQLQRQLQAQRLTTTFPQVQVVVDAPLQMRREVQKLAAERGGSAGVDLAQVLSLLGAESRLQVSAVELSDGELQLHGSGADAAAQTRLVAALASQGLEGRWTGEVLRVRPQEQKP